ncbi:MAG: response regulator [Bacteroidia bacterium]|nr:response regulator [Bacteroidia bacterium]
MDKQKTILVIEDDTTMGRMLKNLLTLNNYLICLAGSGAEGIQKAFEIIPDLILCDIKMKPVDGFQVINTLKQSSITQLIPFVFLTGKTELEDIRLGMQMGADDYIAKPFDNDELMLSIEIRLNKYDLLIEQSIRDLYSLIHLIPCCVIVFEKDGIVEVNNSTIKLLGFDREELVGLSFGELITRDERAQAANMLKRSYLGLTEHGKLDLVLKRNDDSEVHVELSYFQTRTFKGKPQFLGLLTQKAKKRDGEPSEEDPFIDCLAKDFKYLQKIISDDKVQVSDKLADQLIKIFKDYPQLQGKKHIEAVGEQDVQLSRRELEVIELSCKGLAIKEIADKLFISDRTVEKHRASVMEKTGARNIVEAVIYLIKNRLIAI